MLQRTSQQALDISAIVPLTVQASIVIGTRVAAPRTVSCGSGPERLNASIRRPDTTRFAPYVPPHTSGERVPGADSCAVASYVQWLRICHAIELQRLPRARPKPGNHEGVPHRTHARSIAFQWRYRLGYEI
jgi:hypothetical protein